MLALACRSTLAQVLPALWLQAQQIDPAVAGADAQLRAAEQRVFQAKAGFGPTAALTLNKNQTRYNEAPSYELRPFAGKQAVLQVTQPLYRSALFPALESAQAQLEQARLAVEQARADATVRLFEATFDVFKARDTVGFVRAQQVAAEEQLAAARRSFTVGRSPVTDVREAEAKVDTVAAQWIAAQSDLELKQQLVLELAGRPAPELLSLALAGDPMPPLLPGSVLQWIADAQLNNPQLGQAQSALAAAEAEVRRAWQGHAPTADLTYNYTISSDTGTVTTFLPRRGDSSQLGVNVTIPLFAGGATQSRVVEAMALRDRAQSDVEAARRTAQVGVRQSFTAALSSIALTKGLETATRSLEVALRANRRGYEVGMKVNAEVLDSQSKLFEARRDLSKARYDAWLNYIRLKAYAGVLSAADVDAVDSLLAAAEDAPLRGRGAQRGTAP